MRILFIGSVKFSEITLKKLIQLDSEIVGVCTLEESKFNSDHSDLSYICNQNNIPFIYAPKINSESALDWIRSLKPDVIFCFGWSFLLKEELLSIPPKGVVGYHPALLPKNRGRHPLIWALSLGLSETGSTFFYMDEGPDSGDIISQEKILISKNDNADILYTKMCEIASRQIESFYPLMLLNIEERVPQDENKSNYWRKRSLKDGKIDWRMSADSIFNLIKSLSKPYVGAHFEFEDDLITVWSAKIIDNKNSNIEPGKIIKNDPKGIIVKTGTNSIMLTNISPKINLKEGMYL